jgi:ubiquinone/menaquinone biosynthesis C-methylase UbiE
MDDQAIEKQNIRYYDIEALDYDATRYDTRSGKRADDFHKRLLHQLFKEVGSNSWRILELGCGTGRLSVERAKQHSFLVGVDMSKSMANIASSRFRNARLKNLALVLGNANAIPFSDNSFEGVYAILLINLMPDYRITLKEISRVLVPGGILVFNVPNLISIYYPAGLYVNIRRKTTTGNVAGYRYSHWFTQAELRDVMESNGLTIEEIWGEPPHVRFADNLPPLNAMGLGRIFCKSLYIKARLD